MILHKRIVYRINFDFMMKGRDAVLRFIFMGRFGAAKYEQRTWLFVRVRIIFPYLQENKELENKFVHKYL